MGWPRDTSNKVYGKLWNISLAIIIWKFGKKEITQSLNEQALSAKIEVAIIKVMNSDLRKRPREEGSFSEWDAKIKKLWPLIINPPLSYKKKNNLARKACKWELPLRGWKKLNFDKASRGDPGKAVIGCIVREESGN